MTQAAEVDRWPLSAILSSCRTDRPPDRNRVCEIVCQVAAEVRSEIQAGTWRPPSTLRINPRLHGSRGREEDGRRPELRRRGHDQRPPGQWPPVASGPAEVATIRLRRPGEQAWVGVAVPEPRQGGRGCHPGRLPALASQRPWQTALNQAAALGWAALCNLHRHPHLMLYNT